MPLKGKKMKKFLLITLLKTIGWRKCEGRVTLCLEKIDGNIGSFVHLRKEKALEEARKIDEKVKNGEKLGALAGIPVSIKDNMVSEGDISTSCSKILEGYTGIYDATAVKKLKEADAIIIGITNRDEFAMGSTIKTSW